MNAQLAKIEGLDPEYVKRERRAEFRFWGVLAVAIIAIGLGTWAAVVNGEQNNFITKIEKTPCVKDPNGHACQKLRAEVEEQANVRVNCIPFIRAGYECPKPGSELDSSDSAGNNASGHKEVLPSTGVNPPSQPSPPGESPEASQPGVLNPVTESPVVKPILPECHINVLGIQVCS